MAVATPRRGSAAVPEIAGSMPHTSTENLDRAVEELQAHKDEWARLAIGERLGLLGMIRDDFVGVVERWVAVSMQAKGIEPGTQCEGEEWLAGPLFLLRNLRLLRCSLSEIARYGRPRIRGRVTTRPNGQVAARVFPADIWDRVLFRGFTGDVWMEPGVAAGDLPNTQAVAYGEGVPAGKVALVLGAGNVSSIGPMDALYKLFVEKQVVLLKLNPVNAYLGPLIEEGFRALIGRGFLHVAYGGAAEGAHLCRHPGVDEIHITGSDRTHDAIVFGPGEEGARRKAERRPLLTKRVTSELGNVSPVIVVPGPWTGRDFPVPRGQHRRPARQQRRVQLQRRARHRPACRVGRTREAARGSEGASRCDPAAPGLLPGCGRALAGVRRHAPEGRALRKPP